MITNKPLPIMSLPDNWCVFNGRDVEPWNISRADGAAALRRARLLRRHGQGDLRIETVGRYRLSTFNTIILTIHRSCSGS